MAEKKRRPGGRSARVSAAVLDAALSLIETRGLSGFSIADVASRSGVHETTIYRRWGDLDHLLVQTLLERVRVEIPEADTGSLRKDLIRMVRSAVVFFFSPTGRLLLRALASMGEEADGLKRAFWREKSLVLERALERARSRGELGPDVDTTYFVQAIAAPLYFRILVTGDPIGKDFPQKAVDTVLAGAAGKVSRGTSK